MSTENTRAQVKGNFESASNDASMRHEPPQKRDLVAGLEKGLSVIEAFDQQRPRLTISEVAERTGLTRAAARRYLITLSHLGFVSQDRKMFALTPRVLRLGQSYMHSARLPRVVRPEIQRLAQEIGESVGVSVLDDGEVVSVAVAKASHDAMPLIESGTRLPLHCTAAGRVMLAEMPAAEAEQWIARLPLAAVTARTITQPERLRAEISRAREQGYALIDQELELGHRAISVPLRNFRGEAIASMSVVTQGPRFGTEQLVAQCLPLLRQTQAHLRQLL